MKCPAINRYIWGDSCNYKRNTTQFNSINISHFHKCYPQYQIERNYDVKIASTPTHTHTHPIHKLSNKPYQFFALLPLTHYKSCVEELYSKIQLPLVSPPPPTTRLLHFFFKPYTHTHKSASHKL